MTHFVKWQISRWKGIFIAGIVHGSPGWIHFCKARLPLALRDAWYCRRRSFLQACDVLTIFVKMIRWKTSCTLREVHHSITAGISRSCGKADLNWLLRELRHAVKYREIVTHVCYMFASSTLRCRHARCAHEMRLARQLTLSIHHLFKMIIA